MRLIKTDKRTLDMSPEALYNFRSQYHADLGFGKTVTLSSDAFDKYLDNKCSDFNVFSKTKDSTGSEGAIFKTLQEDANKEIRVQISHALTKTRFECAQKKYNNSMGTFKELIKDIPDKHNVGSVIASMKIATDHAIEKIQEQQKQELNALYTALSADGCPFNHADKANMEKTLKEAHKKQLHEFEKSAQETLSTLHKASTIERQNFYFIAKLHQNNKEMRAQIEAFAKKHRDENGQGQQVTLGMHARRMDITGVKAKDLNVIKSITGREINKTEDGKYTVEMPLLSIHSYYNLRHENPLVDLTLMAQAVRACGHEHITFELHFNDKEVANERAKQAYKAAINSGFPPEKITIKVNGTEMKPDKIFEGNPGELAKLKAASEEIQNEFKNLYSKGPNQREMKEFSNRARREGIGNLQLEAPEVVQPT